MKFTLVDITDPKPGRTVIRNSYWLCAHGDETKALFYGTSPQCNSNPEITKRLAEKPMYEDYDVKVVFMDIAFALPHPDQ